MKTIALIGLTFIVLFTQAQSQISLTQWDTPYSEDFSSLISSGSATWYDNSTIPGWYHYRTGTGNTYVAGTGSSNAGGLYSFGSSSASDRALGGVSSGNATVGDLSWGVRLVNNTGQTVHSMTVRYFGEQWRVSGANAGQTVSFAYQVGSNITSLNSGAWISNTNLDFTSPVPNGIASALDGNASANRVLITQTFGVTITGGQEIMLRWVDIDHSLADHGMALDDFSVSFSLTFLPVELVSFRGLVRNNMVELRWKTATESNNYGFEVQRRVGDAEWMQVGFVAGQGTCNTPSEYAFTDVAPRGTLLRYRLRQVDRDGRAEFGPELRIMQDPASLSTDLTLAPNPMEAVGQLSVTLSEPREVELTVSDILGRRILTVYAGRLEAGTHIFPLHMHGSIPGEYLLMFWSAEEARLIRFKKMR